MLKLAKKVASVALASVLVLAGLGIAQPALADEIAGTITISPTSGNVSDQFFLQSVATSVGAPVGFRAASTSQIFQNGVLVGNISNLRTTAMAVTAGTAGLDGNPAFMDRSITTTNNFVSNKRLNSSLFTGAGAPLQTGTFEYRYYFHASSTSLDLVNDKYLSLTLTYDSVTGDWSIPVEVGAPVDLAAGTATVTSVPLTWSAPAAVNGVTITDYQVEFRESGASTWSTFSDGVSSSTGATVTGLLPDQTYEFQVAAVTAQGVGAFAAAVSTSTLSGVPSAPVDLAAGTETVTSVALTWSAPAALNGGTITDYQVQLRESGSSTWSTFSDGESASTGATVTGLSADMTYEFQVAAVTAQGVGAYAAAVTTVTLTGVPTAPVSLAAGTATLTSVPLTWSAPAALNGGTITDYQVQFRLSGAPTWSTFSDAVSSSTGATVTGLTANRTYQFQVAAITAQGMSAYSAAVSQPTLTGITSAPRSLAAGTATATRVPLTWLVPATLNGGTITDYRVQFRLSGATTWSTFSDGVSSTTGATVTGLLANRTYQFQVAAITAQGTSAYAAAVSKTTLTGITSAPRSLAAGTATATRVPLTWLVPATLNGGTITDYRVQFRLVGATTWSTFSDGASSVTGATVTGLAANRTYQFQVAAITTQGTSAYAALVSKTTLTGITSAPRSLTAGTATSSRVPLTWLVPSTLNGGTITDYRVQFRLSGATTWSTFSDGVSTLRSATVTGLLANRTYQFQVAAITAQGTSAYSAAVSKLTLR